MYFCNMYLVTEIYSQLYTYSDALFTETNQNCYLYFFFKELQIVGKISVLDWSFAKHFVQLCVWNHSDLSIHTIFILWFDWYSAWT